MVLKQQQIWGWGLSIKKEPLQINYVLSSKRQAKNIFNCWDFDCLWFIQICLHQIDITVPYTYKTLKKEASLNV